MKVLHPILLILGTTLWYCGFFMAAATVYPYAWIGIYGGPPLLLAGTIAWVIHYKQKNQRFPDPVYSFKKSLVKYSGIFRWHLAMLDFIFFHVFALWIFCTIFMVVLVMLSTAIFKNSTAFNTATEYAEQDPLLKERIGRIKYYGFLSAGTITSDGAGELTFSIIGENGVVNVNAVVDLIEGKPAVTKMDYK